MVISYREYLEMFEFTPEGYLRFDVLLDQFMELILSPRSTEDEREKFESKMEDLVKLAHPEDLKILRSSEFWTRLDGDSG